jgi:hypothetical protein
MRTYLTGKRAGKLTIVGRGVKSGTSLRYVFKCDCGTIFDGFPMHTLKRGHCGCQSPTSEERLVSFLKLNESSGCWEFTGSLNNNGYGQFGLNGKLVYAHRLAWMLWREEELGKFCVLHRCDNGRCCNPNHLFLGTIADNNRDCREKGRHGTWGKSPVNWRVLHPNHPNQ